MIEKWGAVFAVGLMLAACSSAEPKVIQSAAGNPDVLVTVGMATQVEVPSGETIVSVALGDRDLVAVENDDTVITLSARVFSGETNLIIRTRDEDGAARLYQYHVMVEKRD